MWKVSLRGLLAHKARVVLTVFAVMMGVAFITSIYILTDSTKAGFDKLFTTVNAGIDLQVHAQNPVDPSGSIGRADELPPVPGALLDEIRTVEGVRFAEGLVFRSGVAVVGEDNEVIRVLGPSFATNYVDRLELTPYRIREGRAPSRPGEVLVDTRTLESGRLVVGESVDVILPTAAGRQTFTVVGSLGFGDSDGFSAAQIVMFEQSDVQRLFDVVDQFDSIVVSTDRSVALREMADRVQSTLPRGVEVRTGEQVTDEQVSELNGFIGVFATILLAFGFVGVFVAAFLIVNTFSIIVSQRVRELALLRALGASERQIIGSVVFEAGVLGLVASVAGLGVGYLMGKGLKALTSAIGFDPGGVGAVLLGRTVLVGLGIGVGVTIIAAAVPAWRASRTSPLGAVRDAEAVTAVLGRRRTVGGVVALVGGVVALLRGSALGTKTGFLVAGAGGLSTFMGSIMLAPWLAGPASRILGAPFKAFGGITGTVARANLRRNPRRTGITASALMIGLALVTAMLVLTFSVIRSIDVLIERSIAADISVSTTFGGFSTAVRDRVAEVPEVGLVSSYRSSEHGQARVEGARATIEAIEAQAVDTLLRLRVRDYDANAFDAGGVLVAAETADEHGWVVGDAVSAVFPRIGARSLEVAGIFEERGFFDEYLVSIKTFEEGFSEQRDFFVFVGARDGTSIERVKQAVNDAIRDEYPNVDVQDRSELKAQQRQQAMVFLAFFVGLLLLTLIISLLGILNTLALSILERTREIGLLRAVGAHRRQIRQMVRWEAVMISLLGGILGVMIGVVFGFALQRALADFQITELVVPWLGVVVVVVIAGVAGLFSAVYPAWRAGRLDVLEAISTE